MRNSGRIYQTLFKEPDSSNAAAPLLGTKGAKTVWPHKLNAMGCA